MKFLVFDIFEKGQILRPFSGLSPPKLKIFSKNLMVALRYRKKRGPERVNIMEGGGGEGNLHHEP